MSSQYVHTVFVNHIGSTHATACHDTQPPLTTIVILYP